MDLAPRDLNCDIGDSEEGALRAEADFPRGTRGASGKKGITVSTEHMEITEACSETNSVSVLSVSSVMNH